MNPQTQKKRQGASLPKDPNTLQIEQASENENPDIAVSRAALRPDVRAASIIKGFSSRQVFPEMNLMGLVNELRDQSKAVQGGDLARAESMLIVQAHTLDAIFGELARRATLNMGQQLDAFERYMRLALKAQSQCRTTLETLAEIKAPRPVAFVKQANIANGPQQVNNGSFATCTRPGAHAREIQSTQNQLSGGTHELLPDTRASGDASRIDPTLETLEEIDRAKVSRG